MVLKQRELGRRPPIEGEEGLAGPESGSSQDDPPQHQLPCRQGLLVCHMPPTLQLSLYCHSWVSSTLGYTGIHITLLAVSRDGMGWGSQCMTEMGWTWEGNAWPGRALPGKKDAESW